MAVYSSLCITWSWFADCDCQQEEGGSLDAAGALRRANFICGQCPLSAKSLKDVLESVTNRTFEECNLDTPPNADAHQLYQIRVNKVTCLLQDFQNGVNINLSELTDALSDEQSGPNSQDAEVLLAVVQECQDSKKTEEFIKCWADIGVHSCAFQEANEVAADYPDQCKLSL